MNYKTKPEELQEGMIVLHTINLRLGIITKIEPVGSKLSTTAVHVDYIYNNEYYQQFNQGKTGVSDIWYENVVSFTPVIALKIAEYYRDLAGKKISTLFEIEKLIKEQIYNSEL